MRDGCLSSLISLVIESICDILLVITDHMQPFEFLAQPYSAKSRHFLWLSVGEVLWSPQTAFCVNTGRQHSLLCWRPVLATVELSVCLSVCASDTCRHCVKVTLAMITKSSPTDSTKIHVLSLKSSSRNSKGFTPSEGVKWEWGENNSQFSANKSPYKWNGVR